MMRLRARTPYRKAPAGEPYIVPGSRGSDGARLACGSTPVVLLSLRGSDVPIVTLSVVAAACLDYFFTEPRFNFYIDAPQDAVVVTAFAATSFVIAGLVRRARRLGEAAALKDRLQVIIDEGRGDAHRLEEVRFASNSLLEGEGFEPSVPRGQDLCKHRDRRRSRAPGGADRRENGENADLAPSGDQRR